MFPNLIKDTQHQRPQNCPGKSNAEASLHFFLILGPNLWGKGVGVSPRVQLWVEKYVFKQEMGEINGVGKDLGPLPTFLLFSQHLKRIPNAFSLLALSAPVPFSLTRVLSINEGTCSANLLPSALEPNPSSQNPIPSSLLRLLFTVPMVPLP